jgi:hypothetical protein
MTYEINPLFVERFGGVTGHHLLEPGAGTFWSAELNRYYVAAPGYDDEQAAILVFKPES